MESMFLQPAQDHGQNWSHGYNLNQQNGDVYGQQYRDRYNPNVGANDHYKHRCGVYPKTPSPPLRFRDNIAYTGELNTKNLRKFEKFQGLPWKLPERQYKTGVDGLSEEIEDFHKYIMPHESERKMRDNIVARVKRMILDRWPEATVEIFGSFETGLYLPTGDIDMMIKGDWNKIPPLYVLEQHLLESEICDKDGLRVLDKASVPLVKFKDKESKICVDISFNQHNSVRAAMFVNRCCEIFPCLSKLTVVLKQFLLEKNLNEVFTGGVSSYSLILMIVNFLQLHPDREAVLHPKPNIGVLLIEFLELFGSKFDYDKYGLRITGGGARLKKQEFRLNSRHTTSPFRGIPPGIFLTIEDPLTPGNDVAKCSHRMGSVRESFRHAHEVLKSAAERKRDPTHSILGSIIRITDDVERFRVSIEKLSNSYGVLNPTIEPVVMGQSCNGESFAISCKNEEDFPKLQQAGVCTPSVRTTSMANNDSLHRKKDEERSHNNNNISTNNNGHYHQQRKTPRQQKNNNNNVGSSSGDSGKATETKKLSPRRKPENTVRNGMSSYFDSIILGKGNGSSNQSSSGSRL